MFVIFLEFLQQCFLDEFVVLVFVLDLFALLGEVRVEGSFHHIFVLIDLVIEAIIVDGIIVLHYRVEGREIFCDRGGQLFDLLAEFLLVPKVFIEVFLLGDCILDLHLDNVIQQLIVEVILD